MRVCSVIDRESQTRTWSCRWTVVWAGVLLFGTSWYQIQTEDIEVYSLAATRGIIQQRIRSTEERRHFEIWMVACLQHLGCRRD